MMKSFLQKPYRPFDTIDASAISLFRLCFAGTLLFHLWEQFFFLHDKFIKPHYFFFYSGLDFIQPLPIECIYIHFLLMVMAVLGILFGLNYRFSSIIFWVLYTYFFLIDTSYYKNHFYLITLIYFLMIFINAHARFSLKKKHATLKQYRWQLWILRFQFCIVYFFAGIAKMNADWFRGEPLMGILKNQFSSLSYLPNDTLIYAYILGGLIFDLLILY